jgi:hypothetical protein
MTSMKIYMFYTITEIACKYANKSSNPYSSFVYICILFVQTARINELECEMILKNRDVQIGPEQAIANIQLCNCKRGGDHESQ